MPKTAVLTADAKAAKRKAFRKHLKRYWVLYAMLVLPVAYYIVFKYVPMVGNVLAFRRYRPGKGPFGTEWRCAILTVFCVTQCSGALCATRWCFP